jgi:uncharacterized protein (DUF1501 family)
MIKINASRREFLRTSAKLSVAGTAAPFALNLAGIGAAAAQTASDYKALVCVFFYGANDHNNTIIPVDTESYNRYKAARPSIVRPPEDVIPLTPAVALTGKNAGRQFGLAKELGLLKALWDNKKLAVVANVGTLVRPTTKLEFLNPTTSTELPPKLFSHNDQQSVWQSGVGEGALTGWGGRMGDLFASGNSSYPQNSNTIFTCTSATGSAVFLAGQSVGGYQVSPNGSVRITGISNSLFGSSSASATLERIIKRGGGSYIGQDLAVTTSNSISADIALTAALGELQFPLSVELADNGLAAQLRIVANMIRVQSTLGMKRQVFFVGLGGFDTHDDQLEDQPILHGIVAEALAYFQASIDSIPNNTANKVTTFTASDFGRTLTSNGDGSDHGWGSHHFVMGGAVDGQKYYGTFPEMGVGNDDEVGSGRLLPSTSVTEFAATLARWFGVSESDLRDTVLPGITNFQTGNRPINLNFMK